MGKVDDTSNHDNCKKSKTKHSVVKKKEKKKRKKEKEKKRKEEKKESKKHKIQLGNVMYFDEPDWVQIETLPMFALLSNWTAATLIRNIIVQYIFILFEICLLSKMDELRYFDQLSITLEL